MASWSREIEGLSEDDIKKLYGKVIACEQTTFTWNDKDNRCNTKAEEAALTKQIQTELKGKAKPRTGMGPSK
jgi:hypothetical protein